MSLGSALFEEMVFDNGQPINATFLEYMPPSMEDHPREFQSVIVETPHPEGPYGAKGVGEAALGPVEPAIGNAIANALSGLTDQRFTDPAGSGVEGGARGESVGIADGSQRR